MTLDEFLNILEQTPRQWEVLPQSRAVRFSATSAQGAHCPLSYVANVRRGSIIDARLKLRMTRNVAETIANAADGIDGYVRQRLLAACGLTDVTERSAPHA